MRFDLKRACKHCPFANTEHRIKFRGRERAEEIEESAYRNGFVCHEHGESREDEHDENGESHDGITFRQDGTSQHCFGALAMHLKNSGGGTVPFEWANHDGKLEERWWKRVDMKDVDKIFDNEEEFFKANEE